MDRYFHLITNDIIQNLPELKIISIGVLHLFLKHASASLTLNKNTDSSVKSDFKSHFNKMIPEGEKFYSHISEGIDDMPAYIKTLILENSLIIPMNEDDIILGT